MVACLSGYFHTAGKFDLNMIFFLYVCDYMWFILWPCEYRMSPCQIIFLWSTESDIYLTGWTVVSHFIWFLHQWGGWEFQIDSSKGVETNLVSFKSYSSAEEQKASSKGGFVDWWCDRSTSPAQIASFTNPLWENQSELLLSQPNHHLKHFVTFMWLLLFTPLQQTDQL